MSNCLIGSVLEVGSIITAKIDFDKDFFEVSENKNIVK